MNRQAWARSRDGIRTPELSRKPALSVAVCCLPATLRTDLLASCFGKQDNGLGTIRPYHTKTEGEEGGNLTEGTVTASVNDK